MNQRIKFIIAAVMAVILAQTGRSDLVTGYLSFGGAVALDSGSVLTATAATVWNSANIELSGGSFAAITSGSTMTLTTNTWDLNTTAPITNFWCAGGFKFEMQSSQITSEVENSGYGSITVSGLAVVSGNGYTPTLCNFLFNTQDPPAFNPPFWLYSYSFSVVATTTNGEPVLAGAATTNGIVLSWSDPTFSLQAAPTPGGVYTNIPSAVSPYTNAFTGCAQYFRLKQ